MNHFEKNLRLIHNSLVNQQSSSLYVSMYSEYFMLCTVRDYSCVFRIGKATGYKLSELSGLVEGSTLVVGGKQIEVIIGLQDY